MAKNTEIKFGNESRLLLVDGDRCTFDPEREELRVILYGGKEVLFYRAYENDKGYVVYEDLTKEQDLSFGFFGAYTGVVVETGDFINAPFTPDQVVALNSYQRSGFYHPFTCGKRDGHPWEEDLNDFGILVATIQGWICPICFDGSVESIQKWAHSWMAKCSSSEEWKTLFLKNGGRL